MKRITVSLPDDLVERIKRAAGGEGQVSSYVATALADYQEREGLAEILAAWHKWYDEALASVVRLSN